MSATAEEYADFLAHGGVFDLTARTKLSLSGQDRVRYLNGQVTANVLSLAPHHSLPACITTAKGKLNAEVIITAQADALWLDSELDLRDALAARLERYIIADDVTLTDCTETHALWHLVRQDPTALAEKLGVRPIAARRLGQAGWDFWLPYPPPPLGADFLSPALAEVLRIEAGLPHWGRELTEDVLPPEANFDRTHIDYHKGCYIGQETISRLRSVGHVNKQLTGFTSPTGMELPLGGRISARAEPERILGTLTSTVWSFALSKHIALGYLKRGASEDLFVRPADEEEPALEITRCDLPFTAS